MHILEIAWNVLGVCYGEGASGHSRPLQATQPQFRISLPALRESAAFTTRSWPSPALNPDTGQPVSKKRIYAALSEDCGRKGAGTQRNP